MKRKRNNPVGITNKKSDLMSLFLLVMRSEVSIVSRKASETMVTKQVTEAQLLSDFIAKLTEQDHQ